MSFELGWCGWTLVLPTLPPGAEDMELSKDAERKIAPWRPWMSPSLHQINVPIATKLRCGWKRPLLIARGLIIDPGPPNTVADVDEAYGVAPDDYSCLRVYT